jgi:hypothetical protein
MAPRTGSEGWQQSDGGVWVKVASTIRLFSNADGSEKATPLALQDWGLQVSDVIYMFRVFDRSSTAAKLGARHDEGPDADATWFRTHTTTLATATLATAPPLVLRGQTNSAGNGALAPWFVPVVVVGSTGASLESVVVDLYLGGHRT